MSTEALARNKTYFEQFVGSTPDPFKGLAQSVLYPFEQVLELVAGEPDELMTAAQVSLSTADTVKAMAGEQTADRGRLRSEWSGDAADAFHASMESVEAALDELSKGLDETKSVLVDAANAAVDSFNLLLELIFEFLLWFLTEVIIAAVAAALSAGVSLAATVTRVLARFATTLGRLGRILAKFGELLMRLAARLKNVAKMLDDYAKAVLELRKRKKQYGMLKKTGHSAEAWAFRAERFATLFPGKFLINQASPVNIPGVGGALLDTGVGLYDVSDGTKDRNYAVDGTYSEDIGRYSKPVQDIFDTILN